VTARRFARFAKLRVGLLGCCLAAAAVAVTSCAHPASAPIGSGSVAPQAAAVAPSDQPGGRARAVRMDTERGQFAGCENRITRAGGRVPVLAIVGASYTAGVGPDNPALSWAADLARNLRWDAVIDGDPGAGFTSSGTDGLGPMARLLTVERLPSLSPALVILQAGYDDGRVPTDIERQQVMRTVEQVRAQAPHAQIGLVTVFTSPGPIPTRFYRVNATIIAAARSVDPNAIIMDPLLERWVYQHADHDRGLHPTAAGDAWIARKVGSILREHGIDRRPPTAGAGPITCDFRVPAARV
jgi:lysophospholipase L1-like esterase